MSPLFAVGGGGRGIVKEIRQNELKLKLRWRKTELVEMSFWF